MLYRAHPSGNTPSLLKHTISKDKIAEGLPQFTAKEPAVQQSITRFFPSRSLCKQQLQKTTQQAEIKANRREEQMRTREGGKERESSRGGGENGARDCDSTNAK